MGIVGIATLIDYRNFGNRLQNWALQEAIRDLGHADVRTIPNRQGSFNGLSPLRRKYEVALSAGLRAVVISRLAKHRVSPPGFSPDSDELRAFTQSHVFLDSEEFVSARNYRSHAEVYDFVVVGSDQVWNPKFGLAYGLDFLGFCPPKKRVAYAASFGVSSLPKRMSRRYRDGLAGIPSLSVREDKAAALVYELTGRRVPVVLDPTLLIESARWDSVAETPPSLSEKGYVLEFLLSRVGEGPSEGILRFARRADLEVVSFGETKNRALQSISPFEFLGTLRAAKLVVTDSFHAAVFCVVFRVPFVVKPRGGMESRFETLFRKTALEFKLLQDLDALDAAWNTDWDSVHNNIARERDQSIAFLSDALSADRKQFDPRASE